MPYGTAGPPRHPPTASEKISKSMSPKTTAATIFITSAALCNPRSSSGANRKPTSTELVNCSEFLQRTFELVDPAVVVTLGSVALEAIKRISAHELNLKAAAAKIHGWNGRLLVPIYHPSPQVLASHRRERQQLEDYQVVAQAVQQANETFRSAYVGS